MFKDAEDLIRHMELRHWLEKEDLEFKSGMGWSELRPKLVKTALAMANLQGGGYIIIGVKKNVDGDAHGMDPMPQSVSDTYSPDDVSEYLNAHADPDIDVEVVQFEHGGKHVVAIQVHEFKDVPVICKKGIDGHARRGTVYCRSAKPETVPANAGIMRKIIEMAVDKGIKNQIKRVESYGEPLARGDPFSEEAEEEMKAKAQLVMSAIKERGYWEVEIRPAAYRRDRHTLDSLRRALAESQVRHRGWPYPRVAGNGGSTYNMARCVESWTRWGEFAEVFRFYRSGRFVHHVGMVEDRHSNIAEPGMAWSTGLEASAPTHRFLRAESALYYLTEMYLFASNLARRGILGPEAHIGMSLYGQAGRILAFDGRMFTLGGEGTSRTPVIRLGSGHVTANRLRDEHDAMAVKDGLKLAETYNVPADGLEDAMRGWQADFYRRKF